MRQSPGQFLDQRQDWLITQASWETLFALNITVAASVGNFSEIVIGHPGPANPWAYLLWLKVHLTAAAKPEFRISSSNLSGGGANMQCITGNTTGSVALVKTLTPAVKDGTLKWTDVVSGTDFEYKEFGCLIVMPEVQTSLIITTDTVNVGIAAAGYVLEV